jgi:hypothetical protein
MLDPYVGNFRNTGFSFLGNNTLANTSVNLASSQDTFFADYAGQVFKGISRLSKIPVSYLRSSFYYYVLLVKFTNDIFTRRIVQTFSTTKKSNPRFVLLLLLTEAA